MQLPNAPFKILAIAPFNLNASKPWSLPPIAVDRHTLDDAMQALDITGHLPLDSGLCPARGLELRFDSIKSLHPDGMIKNCAYLSHLLESGAFIRQARKKGRSADSILAEVRRNWPDLPLLSLNDPAPRPHREKSTDALDNLLDMVALPEAVHVAETAREDGAGQTAAMAEEICRTIFQWPAFRRLEAAWRGLRLLLQQGVSESNVAVEIAPAHADTLEATLESLTPLIIAQPPSLVLLDIAFDNTPLAMERLAKTAQWASALMVPVIAWIPPEFFQIATWEDLATLPYLPNHTAQASYAKFQKLSQSAEGNWMILASNRFLIRAPYGPDNPPRNILFTEPEPPWVSPVWAAGTLIAQSVCITGWPTRFTQRTKFALQDLALHHGQGAPPRPVETAFDTDRRDQMIRAGITPLADQRDTAFFPQAVCLSGVPLAYQMLVVALSRFLLWCKDNLPSEDSPATLETQLRLAFQVLSEQSRPPAFQSISVNAGQIAETGQIPVQIVITPSADTLPSRQPVEMTINW